MKYKAGDKVRIVSKRMTNMADNGAMDKYLGTVMTIDRIMGRSYYMKEDNRRWSWSDANIQGLAEQMNTMTLDEFKKRGLKEGDIAYFECFNDWGMVSGERSCESINSKYSGYAWSKTFSIIESVSKIIFKEDWLRANHIEIMNFFRGYENYSSFPIIRIINKKMTKYIHAVHFGSTKIYTWRVPKEFEYLDFRAGDIAEVDTVKGRQYVEVRETAEYEHDEKTKEIRKLVEVCDYERRFR
ncbi:DUF5839 family protein [Tissierella sp.]|uniref:DUF5839 family protein n=1 Tax=Tissierella sp. TaxID=41274 RepID=UPI00285E2EDD|nr:DUF5839 family protein [Tissierella sp.]MDR7856022.1 DUF5839 family protein [Tissierella sp.]